MRFKFDPDYVVGAIVMTLVGAVLLVAFIWTAAREIAWWRHPYVDTFFISQHQRFITGIALLLFCGATWLVRQVKGRNDN